MKRENLRVRYGISDIVLNKDENEKFNGTIKIDSPAFSEASFYFDEEDEEGFRYAGVDIVLNMDEMDKLTSKYVKAKDGEVHDDVEIFFVSFEDEDGNELDQDEVDVFLAK